MDFARIEESARLAVRQLDNLIDITLSSVEEADYSNQQNRAIGLGVMGFTDVVERMGVSYESETAYDLIDEIMEHVSYARDRRVRPTSHRSAARTTTSRAAAGRRVMVPFDSIALTEADRGVEIKVNRTTRLDWDALRAKVKGGMRNATLMAIAPTASIGLVAGTTPGFDPQFAQIFSRATSNGKFLEVNANLVRDLQKHGIWEQTREAILRSQGDIQGIEAIPDSIKEVYKTSFQLSPYSFLEVAARAQKWIDQAISRNMYLETRDLGDMMDIYFAAWERGVKTTYYLHMKPRHTAEQSTVKVNKSEDSDIVARAGADRADRDGGRSAGPSRLRWTREGWRRDGSRGCHRHGRRVRGPGRPDGSAPVRGLPVMPILGTGIKEGLLLKPVTYKWAMDLYDQAVANTWFPNEIQLGEDIADFKKMTDEERHAITFLMSYFNPNELLVNKALAFGVYPYINAPEAHLYLAKQMWEEANHCMSFEYVLETFPIDRNEAYNSHVDIPSMARKEEFEVNFIKRMTEETLDITTTAGKQDFIRNLVRVQHHPRGHLVLLGLHGRAVVPPAEPAAQLRLAHGLDRARRVAAPQVRINLILTVLEENPDLQTEEFASEIKQMILDAVEMEEQYNQDLLPGGILGLNATYINQYVKFLADRRLEELGFEPHYNVVEPG